MFPTTLNESASPPLQSRRVAILSLATAWRIVFIFAGYYFGSKIGFLLTFKPYAVSTLWPTNALLLGTLLISPTRLWPILILAVLPAHLAVQLQSNVPPLMIACWFVSNTAEALIGAGLIRRFLKNPVRFDALQETSLFLFFASIVGPFLSSFLDAAFVEWNNWSTHGYWHVWRMRFFSNALAGLTIVPVIVAWHHTTIETIRQLSWRRYAEGLLLFASLFVVAVAVFDSDQSASLSPMWIYLPLPFLLWAATRFGFRVLTTAILMVAFFAIWGAVQEYGPFNSPNPVENAFSIQMFCLVFSFPFLIFASVLQERKNVRERALKNEERLNLALSAARMYAWDLHIPTNRISWSLEFQKLLGALPQGDNSNLDSFLSIVHADDRGKVSKTILQTIQDGGTFEIEFRIVGSIGEIFWLLGKGEVLLDGHGQPLSVLGVNVDITDRKRAEEKQRRAVLLAQSQLFHLSRVGMLGELSGTVAHELNQPLTAILSNAQAAQRYLSSDSVELNELQQIVTDVIDQTRRAGSVIKRLRTLMKKGEEERQPVNLNQIAQEVLDLTHSELLLQNVKVVTDFCDDPPSLQGDRIQLQQVVLNLVMNAVEAMKTIDDRELKVFTKKVDSVVQLSVSDCGIGIPQEKLDQVFEPFHSTKENGMGLGLAISRAIIVAHGGQIQVRSNTVRGVTFQFMLPV